MAANTASYLIVGAGVFGVSTAYHLIQKYPDATVTLVDRDAYDAEERVAASWDWNKVNVIEHHRRLGRKDDIIALPVAEARKLYNGIFEDANYDGVTEVLVNRASGWAAAGDCLRAVTRKAIELGVKYVAAETVALQLSPDGVCTGIVTASGQVLGAAHVILCTGAYTPKLLELSAATSGVTSLRAGDRILAAGITTGMAQLDEQDYKTYVDMPVGFQGYTAKHGKPFVGSLPPTKDRELKWWGLKIFANTHEVVPGRHVSAPPAAKDYSQWKVSKRLKEDVADARNLWYGEKSKSWNMTKHRICWDAFTTSSDFIISPHAAAKGLYVATCGSFHGFKFFPVLGKYIVQMLEDSLSPDLKERWAWDRERPDSSDNCEYPNSEMTAQDERLQSLEEKLDLLLSGGALAKHPRYQGQQQANEDGSTSPPEESFSVSPPPRDAANFPTTNPFPTMFDPDLANLRPGRSDMANGINLYFKFCHRQPIWCFERDEVSDYGSLPEELACSILAVTSRFSQKCDHLHLYGNNAKTLIMLRIANGSAMLDTESVYLVRDAITERKKRLFWSLQLLEQSYGRQDGLLSVPTDIWQPAFHSTGEKQKEPKSKVPPLPKDELGTTRPSEPGIWNTSVHLGWVWSQVRKYVSDCSHNILQEPWRHDSTYAKVLSDFMETENRIPMCHRYDSVKFYERKVEELKMNRDYWAPWLKEQFTYHVIPTVLNHPFLYIIGAQHNPNLGIPNTFWRRSSEQALLHATWIVRMIDMVVDKQVALVDPFFGHAAAIAATVHLYYCCAAAARLKHKSNTDFAKCRRFLKSFIPCSAACGALDRDLDRMTRIAAGSETMDVEDWMPSRIYLSVPLMWRILQFNSTTDAQGISTSGLLADSLTTALRQDEDDENSTLEIVVATSPEISINTADGGQDSPTLSFKAPVNPGLHPPQVAPYDPPTVEQIDSLTFNTTPWLYADSSQLFSIGDIGYNQSEPGNAWWEDENFDNIMFNHF
ncbi:Protein HIR1 [Verticillium dahliae VDG1]|nr:Protein HIR1 [Verticillium dahliae VDG1]